VEGELPVRRQVRGLGENAKEKADGGLIGREGGNGLEEGAVVQVGQDPGGGREGGRFDPHRVREACSFLLGLSIHPSISRLCRPPSLFFPHRSLSLFPPLPLSTPYKRLTLTLTLTLTHFFRQLFPMLIHRRSIFSI
jgi:hypothetical protein